MNSESTRVELLDVLRGLSLIGILWGNLLILGGFYYFSADAFQYISTEDLFLKDKLQTLLNIVVIDKFQTLFSLLFGAGTYYFLKRYNKLSYRRLFWLCIFGLFHNIIWWGDILLLYGLLGFVFLWILKLNLSVKKQLAVIVLLFISPDLLRAVMTQLGYGPYSWLVNIFPPTDYSKFTEMIHQGSLLDNLIGNIRLNGFKWSNYYLESGRYQKILALFLSGHLLAQWRYFETTTYNVRWAVISLAIGLPLNILNAHGLIHILTLKYIGHIALVIFYIECAKSLSTPIINSTLAAYGKMALTHYVGQSVISIFLFYGFGLGLGSKLNLMGHLAVFHIIIATQILYSHWWLKTHQHGPLEQLWRNLYRKSIL